MISVLITARNEFLLGRTIDSVLESAEGEIEIIVVLDGYWPEPIKDDPRIVLIHHTIPRGQRVSINEAARIAKGKYVMKLDAHCIVDKGFDVKLAADCEYNWTVIPRMYNLHAFDWVCEDGHNFYQDKYPPEGGECKECGKPVKIEWVWKPRLHKKTDFMYMDKDLKVQYWYKYAKRKESKGDIVDIMNGVGACWFQHKERFWELGGLDENHGSWGQVGVEVGCKAWLSGGRHVVNRKTWFAHLFRTTKEFTFPYKIKSREQDEAKKHSRDLWLNDKWPLAKREFNWLIRKFYPIPTWPIQSGCPSGPSVSVSAAPLLSVIIPARNEMYLQRTIDDCLAKLTTDFEIIVGLDGYEPELAKDPRVILCHSKERIGMRPMINKMAGMARGKYLMKLDAHCIVAKGIDKELIDCCESGNTVLAIRYELKSSNWTRREKTDCPYRYLSHPDVDEKGGLRGLAWPQWAKSHKDEQIGETMTISGSNWLMEREQFLNWGGLDEKHGTFGQEGVEISCMTWLSGGKVLVNKNTWYAHWNRGKSSYALGPNQKPKSMERSIYLWMGDNWPLAKKKFQWLIDKFSPVPGWEENDLTLLYYTDNCLPEEFAIPVRSHLRDSAGSYPIISISQKPLNFGENICVGEIGRSFRNILFQILTGAKKAKTKFVAMCEHDNIYPKDHFDLRPVDADVIYNQNRTRFLCDAKLFRINCGGLSMSLCIADREVLINDIEQKIHLLGDDDESYRKRFEPGKNKELLDIDSVKVDLGKSKRSILSICNHGRNYGGRNHVKDNLKKVEPDWGTYEKVNEEFHIDSLSEMTLVYVTANNEHEPMLQYVKDEIKKACKPVISVSQKPIKFGQNICVGEIGKSSKNVLTQFLTGAEVATTKYVAMAQSDCLYPPEHFDFKPLRDDVAYWNTNLYRFNSVSPGYVRKKSPALCTLVGNREYLIKTIEEILKTPPDSRGRMIGIRTFGQETFKTNAPVININHENGMHWRFHNKKNGTKAIFYWGTAKELAGKINHSKDYRYVYKYKIRRLDVNKLYDKFVQYADPNKRDPNNPRGVYEFQKTFRPFVDGVLANDEYTDEELKQLPYYGYLAKHIRKLPDYTDLQLDDKGIRHVLKKMRSAENLCKDIRDNGLQSPLCFWRNGKERILQRGQRRVVILKKLGVKKVIALLFNDKQSYDAKIDRLIARSGGRTEEAAERLFAKYGLASSDKYFKHNYTHYYDRHITKRPKKILEVGVWHGASLMLWHRAFPKAKICGVDILDVSRERIIRKNNFKIFRGDATDPKTVKEIAKEGRFDLIVDDGSHNPIEIKATLKGLWPLVSIGGWYVIEDIWNQLKFSKDRLVIMDKLKNMIDDICLSEEVESICFYPNICFIQKNG